jgi:hypothetical protein
VVVVAGPPTLARSMVVVEDSPPAPREQAHFSLAVGVAVVPKAAVGVAVRAIRVAVRLMARAEGHRPRMQVERAPREATSRESVATVVVAAAAATGVVAEVADNAISRLPEVVARALVRWTQRSRTPRSRGMGW